MPVAATADPSTTGAPIAPGRASDGRAGVVALVEGVALFLIVASVYLQSVSPFPASWDTGEMQVAPYILGIPHPTGFPAFMLLGWLFSHIEPLGTVAWRMNAFCALLIASVVLMVRQLALELGANRLAALAASLVFAFGALVWNKASHADVHALALAFATMTLLASARFIVRRERRWLYCAAVAYGLGLATHPNVVWTGPALLIALGVELRRSPRAVLIAVGLAVAPLLIYAYLPIRSFVIASSGVDPANQAPFNGVGEMIWDTNHPRTLDGFITEVFATQFAASSFLDWPWRLSTYDAAIPFWFSRAPGELTVATIVLAAVGLLGALREMRPMALATAAVFLGAFATVPFAAVFAPVEGGDVARYLLLSFAATCVLAALAPYGLPLPRWIASTLTAAILALVAWHLYSVNQSAYGSRYDTGGQAIINDVQATVPDGAVVISNWIDATSIAYGAYVDHSLGHRIPLTYNGDEAHVYRSWTKLYRVFIYANFAILPGIPHDMPKDWLIARRSPDLGHQLFEIRPLP